MEFGAIYGIKILLMIYDIAATAHIHFFSKVLSKKFYGSCKLMCVLSQLCAVHVTLSFPCQLIGYWASIV
jgi:hypothetical protein